jgi:hypothetical protein
MRAAVTTGPGRIAAGQPEPEPGDPAATPGPLERTATR